MTVPISPPKRIDACIKTDMGYTCIKVLLLKNLVMKNHDVLYGLIINKEVSIDTLIQDINIWKSHNIIKLIL